MSNLRLVRRVAVAAVILTFAVGCSPQTANVQGKVTVNGEPLKAGSLQFKSASGTVVVAQIQPDGTYSAVNVPVGMVLTLRVSDQPLKLLSGTTPLLAKPLFQFVV